MGKYGIPYQGSKTAIAESIIEFLPSGKRFVDLFGGDGQFTVNEYIYTNKTIQQSAENPLSIFQSVLYG